MERQVALVTGSSRGIGASIAQHLASTGRRVIINCHRSQQEAETVADGIAAMTSPDQVMLAMADVSQRCEVEEMFDNAISRFGRVDVLINNAGVNLDGPFLSMGDEQWQSVLATNLSAPFVCSQVFTRRLEGRNGHIVNIAAATGITGRRNGANYCSSKAGLITLTKCLAMELAPQICVNTVTPGFINTAEVMDRFNLDDPATLEAKQATIPMARLGTPDDICRAVEFLIGPAQYMTGQNLFVNGGEYMQ